MPIVNAGLIEVVLSQEIDGNPIENVFHYWNQTNSAVLSLSTFLNAWDAVMFPEISNPFSTGLTYTQILGKDIFGTLPDALKAPSVGSGAKAGQTLANFVAARIDMIVATKETRRGYKRFAGGMEADAIGNVWDTDMLLDLAPLATQLSTAVIVGAETYVPVIYGRPTPGEPDRHLANPVTSALVNNNISSQVSRKK